MRGEKMSNNILNGIMGLCVADALGVPVEFEDRETIRNNPVIDMRSYGTYNQPAGTWSDDTSMTLCLTDSLSNGLDYNDIMTNFAKWINTGDYTPYGETFDVGNATSKALMRFARGAAPLDCGGLGENDNGNGSLMRILPILFYLQVTYGTEITANNDAMNIIHNVSALTHAHKRSLIACGIYISVANMLIGDMDLSLAVDMGIYNAVEYYKKHDEFAEELPCYKRLSNKTFSKIPLKNIKSSGYVVDTLEAAIWCLLKTKNYKDCVLTAVNLGEDTDTVAAVAGGLAGLYYGYESIPKEWLSVIAKRDYIESLCNKLYVVCNHHGEHHH
jgi:ADP-ribosyl-[dinitrogen reductase] hydrolase